METLTLDVPTMYGDHHVTEVRRILLEMQGVKEVYASSAFHAVQITYDPKKADGEAFKAALEEAGYMHELTMPVESAEPANGNGGGKNFFRHTAVYEQTKKVVGFAQNVSYSGRPLWPCPGMGVIKNTSEEA